MARAGFRMESYVIMVLDCSAKKGESSEVGTAERGSMRDDVTASVLSHYRDTDFEIVTFITESTSGDRLRS
jgi:hypothetical protein